MRSMAVAGAALVVGRERAGAAISWCRTDPVFKIDGQVVDVWVASDVAMKSAATGPTAITVTIPPASSAQCIAKDRGFGYGYTIVIETSEALKKTAVLTPMIVSVSVPSSDDTLPVKVNLAPRSPGGVLGGTAVGLANQWVTLATG